MKKLFVIFLILASKAHAVDCVDYFAIQHKGFPVKTAAHAGKHFDCLSYLDSTFGTSKRALRAFLKNAKNRPHIIKVHASNEVSRRYNNMSIGDFMRGVSVADYNEKLASGHAKTKKQVINLYKRIRKEVSELGNSKTRLILSLGLESQYSKKAVQNLILYAMEAGFETKNLIHNPVKGAPYHDRAGYSDLILEYHGLQPSKGRPYTVSDDGFRPNYCGPEIGGISGVFLSDAAVQSRYTSHSSSAVAVSFWCAANQGLQRDSNASIKPPRQRTINASRGVLDRYRELIKGEGGPPSENPHHMRGCNKERQWGNGEVLKESDHGGVVFVTKFKYKRVLIVEPNGKKTRLNYTGTGNSHNGKDRYHYRHPKTWASFKNNSVVKGKKRKRLLTKTFCYKTYQSGIEYR